VIGRGCEEMTYNEIVKALECCFTNENCDGCPLFVDDGGDCLKEAGIAALDLINRQKAKIKEKDEMLKAQASKIFLYEDVLKEKTEEIERLNAVSEICGDCHKQYAEKIERAKSEAYKEFAGKHREVIMAFRDDDDQISLKVCEYDANTDNLLKEMTEGRKECEGK
jgi:hypothetical protein